MAGAAPAAIVNLDRFDAITFRFRSQLPGS